MTLLLGAGILFFTSCAGNQVRNMQPPATVLNPDTASDSPAKQEAAGSAVPQSNQGSVQSISSSSQAHHAKTHSRPVVLAAPAAPAVNNLSDPSAFQPGIPLAANVQPVSKTYGSNWPWLLLLLLLLLLLAQQAWSRYQREKAELALDADLKRRGILAQVARLAHQRYLAKRSRLAHLAKLAKEAELVHEAKLAKAAAIVRKGIRAQLALVAHQLMLAKRARLARQAKRTKEALVAHDAKLEKDRAWAHQAKLEREARMAQKAQSAIDAALARKKVLAKGADRTEVAVLGKSIPPVNEGIGAIGSEYSHPEVLTKAAGSASEAVLTKDAPSTAKKGFAKGSESPVPGTWKRGVHTANRELVVPTPGLGQDAVLLKGAGLVHQGIPGKDANLAEGLDSSKPIPGTGEGVLVKNAGLTGDEIWVQGAGLAEMVKVTIKRGATFEEIIVSVARIGNFPAKEAHLFLEDEQVPLDPKRRVESDHPRHLIHHVHTQNEITVAARFGGQELKKVFSPAITVRKVLAWAIREFKIPDQDGREVYLTITGSTVPMSDTGHIGRYVAHDQNQLTLNVMSPARVMG
jgi:hypothetical protein